MSRSYSCKEALKFAKAGLRVLPLYEYTDHCACKKPQCGSPGKHPRLFKGVHEASNDPQQIEAWFNEWPTSNVGIATGHLVCVLDVDLDKGGESSFNWMKATYGELPPTWTARTGGGGRHYYFRMPDEKLRNGVKLWARKGLDFRGNNGYVVAPPSTTDKGGYRWLNKRAPWEIRLAEIPGFLLHEMRQTVRVMAKPKPKKQSSDVIIESLAPIGEGSRNDELARICGKLIRAGKDQAESLTILQAVNIMYCNPPLGSKPGDDPREVEKIHASVWRCEMRK